MGSLSSKARVPVELPAPRPGWTPDRRLLGK
jgi:hypothetical protein